MSTNLTNDHNVYVLGAGFSREAGLPLIKDFMNCLRDSYDWLRGQNRLVEADAVNDVLEFRLRSTSAAYWTSIDLENIEELFSLASADAGDLAFKTQTAIASVLDFAAKTAPARKMEVTLTESLKLELPGFTPSVSGAAQGEVRLQCHPYVQHVGKLLGYFMDGKIKGKNTFISFNYDTVVEDALCELRCPFHYGFEKQTVTMHGTSKAESAFESTGVSVLKIHGSVNWARKPEKGGRLTVYGTYDDVRKAAVVPELVPPSWQKKFENQLLDVWRRAIQELQTATRIIVIGFSIPPTDNHFKYLLASGLRENVSLRQICFVDPFPDNLKSKVARLFREEYLAQGTIRFEPASLNSFTTRPELMATTGRPVNSGFRHWI